VAPNSSCNCFAGIYAGRLKIKIKAKAIDGAANKAIIDFLASNFGVAKSHVTLVKGARSREKTFLIVGDAVVLTQKCAQFASVDQET
jgi:hypothetical protein